MKRWEYCLFSLANKQVKVITEYEETMYELTRDWEKEIQGFLKVLNGYGQLGWEVVGSNEMLHDLLLKRSLDEPGHQWDYAHAELGDEIMVVSYEKKKKNFKLNWELPDRPKKVQKILNSLGLDGWEIVQHDWKYGKYLFKKVT